MVNSSAVDNQQPSLSCDGTTLYFTSNRAGNENYDFYVVTRKRLEEPAPVLLPDQLTNPPHLLAHVGKGGVVYLIDRENMGHYAGANACTGTNQTVQSFSGAGGVWGTPAFWQNGFYTGAAGNPLTMFSFDTSTGLFNTTPASQSVQVYGYTGTTPSASSQGTSHGIVWTLDVGLYGYASPNAAGGDAPHGRRV